MHYLVERVYTLYVCTDFDPRHSPGAERQTDRQTDGRERNFEIQNRAKQRKSTCKYIHIDRGREAEKDKEKQEEEEEEEEGGCLYISGRSV